MITLPPSANTINHVDAKTEINAADLLREASATAYRFSELQLLQHLKTYLGRPLIAHITGVADANTVSRWSSGKACPDRATWERLRTLATVHIALSEIVGSPKSAGQWFTGLNPDLGDQMPADKLRQGQTSQVFAAVRLLAQQ